MFTDIHSHILPAVDDGAADFEAAEKLLISEKENGVDKVILTPHFYADLQPLSKFTGNIRPAFYSFRQKLVGKDLPEVFLGCELHWFRGVADTDALSEFMISGSDYLLLELPFMTEIEQSAIADILKLYDYGIKVIIAHTERYYRSKHYRDIVDMINDGICLCQINAQSVLDAAYKKPALKLFDKNLVSFVGSDAHSLDERPVKLKEALSFLEKRNTDNYKKILFSTQELTDRLKG